MPESVAIVAGASQGIGQATAVRLARDFAALVLVSRSRANLESTAERVKSAGADVHLDLAQPPAAQTVVERTLARFGRIDALLNIAGAAWRTPPDGGRMAGAEGNQGLRGSDFRQLGVISKGTICGRGNDRRDDGEIPTGSGHLALRRSGEIAELMAFLVSPAARWMTGSALRMDGGEVKPT